LFDLKYSISIMIFLQILFQCLWPCITIASEASYQKLAQDFSGYSLIQTVPKTKENVELLRSLHTNINPDGMDFWSFPTTVGKSVLLLVKSELYEPIQNVFYQQNMTFNVTLRNVSEMIEEEMNSVNLEKERFNSSEEAKSAQRKGQYPFNVFNYNPLKEINNYLTHVSQNTKNYNPLPGLNVSQHSIGTTYEGRSINMITITLNDGKKEEKKAGIWMDCGIHAREWISPAFCMYSIDRLIRLSVYLLRRYDFYIVPVLNPDGYAHTWIPSDNGRCEDGMCRLWRKNRKPVDVSRLNSKIRSQMQLDWKKQFQKAIKNFPEISFNPEIDDKIQVVSAPQRSGRKTLGSFPRRVASDSTSLFNLRSTCQGVDLNRNFEMYWNTTGSSDNPCDSIFHGPTPFSEKESNATREAINSIKSTQKIASYVTVHSFSQLWFYPYSIKPGVSPHRVDLDRVARKSVSALSSLYKTQYKYGKATDVIYEHGGNSVDWAHGKAGIKYSYLLELRPGNSLNTSEGRGFILDREFIRPTVEETWAGIKAMCKEIMQECGLLREMLTNCDPQQCIGYKGTNTTVLHGYCKPLRDESEVCGTTNAPSPNEKHEVFLGYCKEQNECINNKCIRKGM